MQNRKRKESSFDDERLFNKKGRKKHVDRR